MHVPSNGREVRGSVIPREGDEKEIIGWNRGKNSFMCVQVEELGRFLGLKFSSSKGKETSRRSRRSPSLANFIYFVFLRNWPSKFCRMITLSKIFCSKFF